MEVVVTEPMKRGALYGPGISSFLLCCLVPYRVGGAELPQLQEDVALEAQGSVYILLTSQHNFVQALTFKPYIST